MMLRSLFNWSQALVYRNTF